MRYKYAIYDMDGLMYDTERLFVESFLNSVSPKTGMDFKKEDLVRLIGLNEKSTREVFPKLFGTKYSYDECYAISNEWIDEYLAKNGVPVKPGLRELLSFQRENGFKIAMATSSNMCVAKRNLEDSKLAHYFDVIVSGDMVTRGKPDPQIFNMAAEELACPDKKECIIFEDSENGLLAAHNAGIDVIIVPDLIDPDLRHPGLCYAKIPVLSDAIKLME